MNDLPKNSSPPPYAALVPATGADAIEAAPDPTWPLAPPPVDASVASVEFTPGKVLRALRRRWLLALLVAIVGAGVAGYFSGQVVSSNYMARTQVSVPIDRPGVPFAGPTERADVTSYQRRQSAFVRSRHVLEVALQQEGIADLSIVRDNTDPIGWLEKELLVDFNSAPELMRITLKGSPPEELLLVLNAVREAYLKEAANRDVTDKRGHLEWLRKLTAEEQGKLDLARAAVREKAAEMNAPDAATVKLRYTGDSGQLAALRIGRFQLDLRIRDLEKAREKQLSSQPNSAQPASVSPAVLAAAVEEAVAKDTEIGPLRATARRIDAEVAEYKRRIKPGSSTQVLEDKEAELRSANSALAAREEFIKDQVSRRFADDTRQKAELAVQDYHSRLAELTEQIASLGTQLAAVDEEIRKRDAAAQKDMNGLAELDRLAARVAELETKVRIAEARADLIGTELTMDSPQQARTLEEAVIVQVPNPAKRTWVLIGMVVTGFVGGLLAVAYLDLRHGRIDSPEGVDKRLHTGVVGCIPHVPSEALAAITQSGAPSTGLHEANLYDAADSCRTLLLNALSGSGSKVIMVTSALAGEGKTTLASQLAMSLGRGGYRTLLIDADTRHPGVHNKFGRSPTPGLTDVLRKTHAVQTVVRKSPLPNVGIIPAGQCNPQEAVALFQLRIGSLLRKCKPHFEVIVIDTPPLGLPDAMVIGRHVDGTILSLMNEVSTLPAAQAACARLRTLNIPLLGAVLNAARVRTPAGY